ncbi:MAG: hypothetical protein AAB355_00645 [Patescibacteria group bacterium]
MAKKRLIVPVFLAGVLLFSAFLVSAAVSGGELRITKDGAVSIKGAKVFQKAGRNFYARIYWGDLFLRLTVVTGDSTKITKKYGEPATADDIKEGDMLDIEGVFPSSSDTFIFTDSYIKDLSLEKQKLETSGTVISSNGGADEFKMKTKKGNIIKVVTSAADMKRGIIPITASQLLSGEKVSAVRGTFDYSENTLYANTVQIYQNKSVFSPKFFSGKITSISGASLPLDITVNVSGKNYTVKLSQKTALMNKNKETVVFSRFLVGDNIVVYGAIREDNLSIIDNVGNLRNLSL